MATKNIEINYKNNAGYDILYPKTVVSQISDLSTYLNNFIQTNGLTKYEIKHYVGTGTVGPENPVSLVFSFPIKVVLFSFSGGGTYSVKGVFPVIYNNKNCSEISLNNENVSINVTWNGNTISWYANEPNHSSWGSAQLNGKNGDYYVVGFG